MDLGRAVRSVLVSVFLVGLSSPDAWGGTTNPPDAPAATTAPDQDPGDGQRSRVSARQPSPDDEGKQSSAEADRDTDGREPKIIFRTPLPTATTPRVFDPGKLPPDTAVLPVHLAVRPVEGLNVESDDHHEHRTEDQGEEQHFAFSIRVVWTLSNPSGQIIRTVETSLPLVAPFVLERLTTAEVGDDEGHERKEFIVVDTALSWDGRAQGICEPDGSYPWVVQATLLRTRLGKHPRVKTIGQTPAVPGVTLLKGSPPQLTVTFPPQSPTTITRSRTITVTGSVATGATPATLLIQGSLVPSFSGGSFSVPVTFPADGLVQVTESASDCAGRPSSSQNQAACIDGSPPRIAVTSPKAGTISNNNKLAISIAYQTVQPCDALDLTSLAVTLNGGPIGPFTAGPSSAQFAPSTPWPDDRYTAQGSIFSLAGVSSNSDPVSFMIDATPPQLTIDLPAPGAVLSVSTPQCRASFSDNLSGILASSFRAVLDDTQDISSAFTVSDTAATGQVPAANALTAGSHRLQISISDRALNVASQAVSFTYVPPSTGPSGRLTGQILSGTICNPVPIVGATVSLLHAGGQTAVTDAQGRFVLATPVGLQWVQIDAPGRLYVQRSAKVFENEDASLPTVFLAATDSKVTHVAAAVGGTVSDSTNTAFLDIPAGALPRDADIIMTSITDSRSSQGPPMQHFIPGAEVRILPEGLTLNSPATLRTRNLVHMPVHPIGAYSFNPRIQVWEPAANAFISGTDGFYVSFLTHFSGGSFG